MIAMQKRISIASGVLAAVLAAGVRMLYLPWAVVMVLGLARWAWLEQGNGVKTRHALAALGGWLGRTGYGQLVDGEFTLRDFDRDPPPLV